MQLCYGNTTPARAFIAETSAGVIKPDAFTSNLKFACDRGKPDCDFTALMSLALTDRELLKSPMRKPIETG